MKKLTSFLAFALLVVLGLSVASCSSDNEQTPQPQDWSKTKAKYTIMFYGCGGSDVDIQFEGCIEDVMKALGVSNNQVRFTVFYSMSQSNAAYVKKQAEQYKVEPYFGEFGYTYRFELTPQTDLTRQGFKQYKYKPASQVTLRSAQTIADFINWTKQNAPAENYILMPVNHGGGFDMSDETLTRAICYDDNTPDTTAISTASFVEALKSTNTHLKAIYWYGCLMGQSEVLTGAASVCDYQFASTHSAVVQMAHPVCLVNALNKYPNAADFEQAAKYDGEILKDTFIKDFENVLDASGKGVAQNCDFGCWRCSSLAAVNEQIKKLKNLLVAGINDDELCAKVTKAIGNVYVYEKGYTYVDVVDLANNLAKYYGDDKNAEVKAVASALKQAIDNAHIYRFQKINVHDKNGVEVCPINKEFTMGISVYSKLNLSYLYYGKNYKASVFDQSVKWSDFLDVNLIDVTENNPSNDSAWELKWLNDDVDDVD